MKASAKAFPPFFVRAILLVGWMTVIFLFSAQPATASAEVSGSLSELLLGWLSLLGVSAEQIGEWALWFDPLLRKGAHFVAFALLGILSMWTVTKKKNVGRTFRQNVPVLLISFTLCVLFAITDEVHQTFVPGRSGQVSDVLLDSAGIATGVLVYVGVAMRRLRK